MSDDLGLHKISNPNLENLAVSLHRKSFTLPGCDRKKDADAE
jgi:hypothetical protein